jgi:hypothetical protein
VLVLEKTALFTWHRDFQPILRLSLRKQYGGLIDLEAASADIAIPFCEARPIGDDTNESYLLNPGTSSQDIPILKCGGTRRIGGLRVMVELQGVSWARLKLRYGRSAAFDFSPRFL